MTKLSLNQTTLKHFVVTGKFLFSVALLASLSTLAHAGECRVEGNAYIPGLDPNAASGEPGPIIGSWDQTETVDYLGAQLPGALGGPSGSDRTYSGPADATMFMFGPYRSFEGIAELGLSSRVEFSTNWRPDGREYCSKHKTRPNQSYVCVEKSMAYDPTSFVIDIAQNYNGVLGTPIYSAVFTNVNNFNHGTIYLPNLRCSGNVSQLEVRISGLTGGSVDFTVHSLHLDARWRY